jgi:hypothetical protein
MAMARSSLSPDLKAAGSDLLAATDRLGLQAQGAMWLYDHALSDWRYYLVTSLVDTIGRRKTYGLLLDIFEANSFPKEMTVDDVYLGSPNDPLFKHISGFFRVPDNFRMGPPEVEDLSLEGTSFNAVFYRAVVEVPSAEEAEKINKRFAKHVKDLLNEHRGKKPRVKVESRSAS